VETTMDFVMNIYAVIQKFQEFTTDIVKKIIIRGISAWKLQ
jgi:hypothetical protein